MSAPHDAFREQVQRAYQHLYDLAYLSTQSELLEILVPEKSLGRRERAWRLHHMLLDAIEALSPGPRAPALSSESRRYRLMVQRYINGLEVDAIAEELHISRRQFYRDHDAALDAIAIFLHDHIPTPSELPQQREHITTTDSAARLELLRREAARLRQERRFKPLKEVAEKAVQVVCEIAQRQGVRIQVEELQPTEVDADQGLVRQILIGLLGALVDSLASGTIYLTLAEHVDQVLISLRSKGSPKDIKPDSLSQIGILQELAAMQQASIEIIRQDDVIVGFDLHFTKASPPVVLIVDDNQDMLELLERYLTFGGYQVIRAATSAEALRLARERQPYAITLDLMMPDQDGWDVLQTLTAQPQTQHIPIVVCTVLSAKELALSLGATAFLEKPVSSQALLETLKSLTKH